MGLVLQLMCVLMLSSRFETMLSGHEDLPGERNVVHRSVYDVRVSRWTRRLLDGTVSNVHALRVHVQAGK